MLLSNLAPYFYTLQNLWGTCEKTGLVRNLFIDCKRKGDIITCVTTEGKRNKRWSNAIGFGIAGAFVLCGGLELARVIHPDIFLTGECVEGTVEGTESRRVHCGYSRYRTKKDTADYAIVSYTTRDGRALKAASPISNPADYRVGDKVRVYYKADSPTTMRLLELATLSPAIFPLVGIVLLGVSVVYLFLALRTPSEK